MKTITINNKEYTLEYTFKAAEHRDTVQKMFNIASGAYIVKQAIGDDLTKVASAMIDGTSEMVADIPSIVKTCFYSGLLENHKVTEEESHELMKNYMKENKINFKKLFDEIKQCMEDDDFFELSGLMDMIQEMNANEEKQTQPEI